MSRWKRYVGDQLIVHFDFSYEDQVLEWENDLSRYEERSVTATFTFALEQLQQAAPGTSDLLRILAFLDPESVPVDVLKHGCTEIYKPELSTREPRSVGTAKPKKSGFGRLKERLSRGSSRPKLTEEKRFNAVEKSISELKLVQKLLGSTVDLQRTIQHLQRLSLVVQQRAGGATTLWLHDLTQLVLRTKLMDEPERKKWLELAIGVIGGSTR